MKQKETMINFCVRLPQKGIDSLREVAKHEGRTVAQIIRRALSQYVANAQDDLARERMAARRRKNQTLTIFSLED